MFIKDLLTPEHIIRCKEVERAIQDKIREDLDLTQGLRIGITASHRSLETAADDERLIQRYEPRARAVALQAHRKILGKIFSSKDVLFVCAETDGTLSPDELQTATKRFLELAVGQCRGSATTCTCQYASTEENITDINSPDHQFKVAVQGVQVVAEFTPRTRFSPTRR